MTDDVNTGPATPAKEVLLRQQEQPLKEISIESLLPLNDHAIDLEKADSRRRANRKAAGDESKEDDKDWNKHLSESSLFSNEEGKFASAFNELPEKGREMLKVAACLGGSFDMRLLEVATSTSGGVLSIYLEMALHREIIKENKNGLYSFASEDAEKEVYALIPATDRQKLHLSIGRSLVQKLPHVELERNIFPVLLQFHCAESIMTSQRERNAIAVLCLRGTHCAVAVSDFRAACNYAEFGILLLPDDCWKDEYDLTLALYNASAEVCHCVADYKRVHELVDIVLEHARCFQDSLRARAARVHSLSSSYKITEALEEGLDILRHLGENFPYKKLRKYHAVIEFVRTKRLLRGKTNEMILRMPPMENPDKIAAMQMLNLIFPNAFHVEPVLFVLIALRLVRLSERFGLTAVSSVGFAAYSSFVANFNKDKTEGYRYSDLSLQLIGKFRAREFMPRVYFFLYSETMTHKYDLRTLCSHLYRGYQVGLETGDIEFALVNSNMCFGYMLLSGQSLERVEEKTTEFYDTALLYKQETTLGTMRPALKCLHILMGKVERPTGFAFSADLTRSEEAKDEAAIWIIHFMQLMISYFFGDYNTAAQEAEAMEAMLRLHLHPGFSSLLVAYCLALLTMANNCHGRARRELLKKVRRSMKRLEQFSSYIPENALHKLSLVQAELAVVNGDLGQARGKYLVAISLASELDDLAMRAIGCERFAVFVKSQGDGIGALHRFQEAHEAYKKWGAIAKVKQMEKEMPELVSEESNIILL